MNSITVNPSDSLKIQSKIEDVGNTPSEFHFNSGSYDVVSRIRLYSNTKITCDPDVTFELMADAPTKTFGLHIPVFGQKQNFITGLDISGIKYNGNYATQKNTPDDHGTGYGDCFGFGNITNSVFHDMDLGFNEGDEFRIEDFSNSQDSIRSGLEFYNITSQKGGHDCINLNDCKDVKIHNCDIKIRANNAVRVRGSSNIFIFNNEVDGSLNESWGPGIQCETLEPNAVTSNLQIYENYIHDTFSPGVWLFGGNDSTTTKSISIRNNFFNNCGKMPKKNKLSGTGAIVCDGYTDVEVRSNTIFNTSGYGILLGHYLSSCPLDNLKISIEDNTIIGMSKGLTAGTGSGSAIANLLGSKYTVTARNNYLVNNINNYYKVIPIN